MTGAVKIFQGLLLAWVLSCLPMDLTGQSLKPDTALLKYALAAPKTTELPKLAKYLSEGGHTDRQKAEIFFYWITQNIAYDYALSRAATLSSDQVRAEIVLKRKATVCSGYADLFKSFCVLAGIKCITVSGKAVNYGQKAAGHDWNAVYIDGKWNLVDCTWGAGFITQGGMFKRYREMKFFFAVPAWFIVDHYPDNSEYQLLDRTISYSEFEGKEFDNLRYKRFHQIPD